MRDVDSETEGVATGEITGLSRVSPVEAGEEVAESLADIVVSKKKILILEYK